MKHKFPKIWHLPWSQGITSDDRMLSEEDVLANFGHQPVVVSEKLDGENATCSKTYYHARSLDSRDHPSRSWIKKFHAQIAPSIPDGWRVCGENVYAVHSVSYDDLPSYFFVFAVYNEDDECLDWDETATWCKMLDLETVPVLYEGEYDEAKVRACFTGKSVFGNSKQEGYVMRLRGKIPWEKHKDSFGKAVRKGHVQTDANWMYQKVVPNKLKERL